jgi:hypothetical protein
MLGDLRIDPAFRKFKIERVDVVIVLQASFLILDRAHIAAAAAANRLPTVCGYREHVETGGLISYGVNLEYRFRRAATYVYKILKGTPAPIYLSSSLPISNWSSTSRPPRPRPHRTVDAPGARRRGDRVMGWMAPLRHRPLLI